MLGAGQAVARGRFREQETMRRGRPRYIVLLSQLYQKAVSKHLTQKQPTRPRVAEPIKNATSPVLLLENIGARTPLARQTTPMLLNKLAPSFICSLCMRCLSKLCNDVRASALPRLAPFLAAYPAFRRRPLRALCQPQAKASHAAAEKGHRAALAACPLWRIAAARLRAPGLASASRVRTIKRPQRPRRWPPESARATLADRGISLALRTSLSMQGQSRNTITTNIRYDRGNRVIGRDLIATYLGAYGKYRWRRVEAIGLTGSVTLGAGNIDIAANRWIDGHASCRHFCSVLQAKLCPHPVTELPNSENHQNEQRQGYRKFNRGSAPPVLEETLSHLILTVACAASVTVLFCHGLGMIGLNRAFEEAVT
jgi:hypothetical protein